MRTNESGRTMLEMIGVLVLMGLLTVGSLALFGNAISKTRVNNLLDEVRKRALVVNPKSSKATYGIFDKQEGGASPISAYGYGIGDNTTGATYDSGTAKVPVGKVNGGKALDKKVCEELLGRISTGSDGKRLRTGELVGVYKYSGSKCSNNSLSSCGAEDEEGPQTVCLKIKF